MHTTVAMTVFIGCDILASAACQSAVASPLPQVAVGTPAPTVSAIESATAAITTVPEPPMSWWFPRLLPPWFPPSPLQLRFHKARR